MTTNNKEIFAPQQIMAIELSEILTNTKVQHYLKEEIKDKPTVLPNASLVYERDIVCTYIKNNASKLKDFTDDNYKITQKQKKYISISSLVRLHQ